MEKPASRGGEAGLSDAFRQVSNETHTALLPTVQIELIARRHRITLAHATLVAELAYAVADDQRGAR